MGECARRAVAPTTRRAVTREPEMVKAYRDSWTLGVHSYLAYAFEYSGVAFGNAGASAPSAADTATPKLVAAMVLRNALLEVLMPPYNSVRSKNSTQLPLRNGVISSKIWFSCGSELSKLASLLAANSSAARL